MKRAWSKMTEERVSAEEGGTLVFMSRVRLELNIEGQEDVAESPVNF